MGIAMAMGKHGASASELWVVGMAHVLGSCSTSAHSGRPLPLPNLASGKRSGMIEFVLPYAAVGLFPTMCNVCFTVPTADSLIVVLERALQLCGLDVRRLLPICGPVFFFSFHDVRQYR